MDDIELMDIKAAAEYLRISKTYIYKLVKEKRIKHIRLGVKIMLTKQMLNEFLLSNIIEKENDGRKGIYL